MTKLSDTQAIVLSAAAQRPEHIALPLPESLRGGAATKVVSAMLAKGFLQEVDADLRKDGLDIAEYNILVNLSEAPERKLRMSQLADDVVHSRSRLTHTVSRLEKSGHVVRTTCSADGRGVWAQLTGDGFQLLTETAPHHVAAVRKVLVDPVDDEDYEALGRAMRAVLQVTDGTPVS